MSRRASSKGSPPGLLWPALECCLAVAWAIGPAPLPLKLLVLAMNVVAFVLYKVDKERAIRGAWRIPEAWLFAVTLLGGLVGADWARRLFRHKTQKASFTVCVAFACVGQLAALGFVFGVLHAPLLTRMVA
jgi:uncharacterized membrane protein YsdA (DUF1294 family)